jgi:hypothetical protein
MTGPAHLFGVGDLAAHGVDLTGTSRRPAATSPPAFDEWEFEHDLRQLSELASALEARPSPATTAALAESGPHLASLARQQAPRGIEKRGQRPGRGRGILAWTVLSLGLLASVVGGTLLVMSFAITRQELWSLGLPITIGGQVCLLLGLVLQLERVWQGSRYAVDMLDEVDERLADLKTATNLLGATRSSASQAFYAHLAEGASPHLLLADLKGQLDLLAVRMSQRN